MKVVLRVVITLVILLLGVGAVRALIALKPTADKVAPAPLTTTVEVLVVQRTELPAKIQATGVVEPSRQVVMSPEVNGRIVWIADALVPGGRVRAGQTLLKIDPRDYRLAVDQQESLVERANLTLELERSQQGVVEKEWKLLNDTNIKPSQLALRVPQVKNAEVGVKSAVSGLERSKLALERTTLQVPFNALVLNEQVEVGQVTGPGSPAATLIGTDRFWVTAQLPVERLSYLQMADDGGSPGSEVLVVQDLGAGSKLIKKGRVLRLRGVLDPATRTASVVIGVDNPLDPTPTVPGAAALPLLPGAFVNVVIEGKKIEDTFVVPRKSLSEGDNVWVVDAENRLRSMPVTIAWRTANDVYVTEGLSDGARVVSSTLALPLEGMKVEIVSSTTVAAVKTQAQGG